jgi:hypothetical protein
MCKKALLRRLNMSAYVAEMRQWADVLVERERLNGSKIPSAMADIAQRAGLAFGDLWALRYRPRRKPALEVYMLLKAAYEWECERVEARLAHELTLTKAMGRNAVTSTVVAEAEALLRKEEGAA